MLKNDKKWKNRVKGGKEDKKAGRKNARKRLNWSKSLQRNRKEKLGKTRENPYQLSLFGNSLLQLLNPNHGLVKLSSVLPWERMEKHLSGLYPSMGAPSHPIRKMVGLLLLQHLFRWSDRSIVEACKKPLLPVFYRRI
jgi:hypothetical protein